MDAGLQGIGLGLGRLGRPGYADIERLVVGRVEPADAAVLLPWVCVRVSVPSAVPAPWAEFGAALWGIQAHATDSGGSAGLGGIVDVVEVSVRLHGGILSGSMKRPTPATLTAAGVFEDYWMREIGVDGSMWDRAGVSVGLGPRHRNRYKIEWVQGCPAVGLMGT